ncbi:transcriptional regulator, TetR family protein [Vibrio ichthyoenteri ATCC 700023]|uniref:Transcriptional regulator, TetR family protein n=1 Tax=Vibrio ichthyoenteri ATCC 700023 TaxID=870968 RepID=F9RZ58_9VIBR|nr:transcriptional regulator, TetR family protein [Vibrio ichthyoenteri ATCC 700023]
MDAQGPAPIFSQRFEMIIASLNLDCSARYNALGLLVDYLHGFALTRKCNNGLKPLDIEISNSAISLICIVISSPRSEPLV